MKPTVKFQEKLLANEDKFQDEFFKRYKQRHAPAPLQLSSKISKDYLFPTFYSDVTCAIAVFMCDYDSAAAMMPHPQMKPIKMTKSRSLVIFSCYEYNNVLHIPSYNEIAMTIPVMVNGMNVPVLPMVMSGLFKKFGYYVFSMPVTSLENQIRGTKIWGLPKVVEDIDITEANGDCTTIALDGSGNKYFELSVPTAGSPTQFDISSNLYSILDEEMLQSETSFKAAFNMTKHMNLLWKKDVKPDRPYLKIGEGPSAQVLRDLNIEEHPFQLRFAKHMNACFDLHNPGFEI